MDGWSRHGETTSEPLRVSTLFFPLEEERDLSHLSFGADPLPEIVHVALGFEGNLSSRV